MQIRLAVAALIGLVLAGPCGCIASYRPLPGPAPQAAAGKLPRALRVTRSDGSRVLLYEAQLQFDTLIGWNDISSAPRFLIRVSVADIRQLSQQRTNWPASIGAVVGISLVAYVVWVAATIGNLSGWN